MKNLRSDDPSTSGQPAFAPRARCMPAGLRRCLPRVAGAAMLAATMMLAACADEPPLPQTPQETAARERSDAALAADADAAAPDLRDVPARPEASSTPSTREKVVEGLIADRTNARYTDEAIRLQGTGRQPDRSIAAATPAPAAETVSTAPIAQPAPPQPAPPQPAPPQPVPAPQQAAAVPAAPQPAAPVAAAPRPSGPIPANAQPAAPPMPAPQTPIPAAPQVAAIPPAPPRTMPAPPPPSATTLAAQQRLPTATPQSEGAVTVDTSALDGLGSYASDPLASGGDQVATIQFGQSSSRLDERDRSILQQVAAIQRQTGGRLVVVGHASSRTQQLNRVEHEIANLNVSMARANAVAEVLVASGVAPTQVSVEAVSDGQPMFTESMPTGEAGNRRAEIFLLR